MSGSGLSDLLTLGPELVTLGSDLSTLCFLEGEATPGLRLRFRVSGRWDVVACDWEEGLKEGLVSCFCDCFCFENMAWIPSLRFDTGSMNVADSVPTFPTSLGTW
jgi:hypothetical protein